MTCIPGCFRFAYLPRTKLKDQRIFELCIANIIPFAITTAFPRYQDASPRTKIILNPGGGKGISEKEEISAEAPRPRKCQARAQLQAAGTCTSSVVGYVRNAQKAASCRFKSSVPACGLPTQTLAGSSSPQMSQTSS